MENLSSPHHKPITLMDTKAAAALMTIQEATLVDWRVKGVGPTACKVGRLVRYDLEDIMEWLRSRRTEGTARFGRKG